MAASFGYSPRDVDLLSWYDVGVMLKGAHMRRKFEWHHTAQICAAVENIVHGIEQMLGAENVKFAAPVNYVPSIYREKPAQDPRKEAKRRWEQALWQMKHMIDVRNERRAKKGLPPLPYKKL